MVKVEPVKSNPAQHSRTICSKVERTEVEVRRVIHKDVASYSTRHDHLFEESLSPKKSQAALKKLSAVAVVPNRQVIVRRNDPVTKSSVNVVRSSMAGRVVKINTSFDTGYNVCLSDRKPNTVRSPQGSATKRSSGRLVTDGVTKPHSSDTRDMRQRIWK